MENVSFNYFADSNCWFGNILFTPLIIFPYRQIYVTVYKPTQNPLQICIKPNMWYSTLTGIKLYNR